MVEAEARVGAAVAEAILLRDSDEAVFPQGTAAGAANRVCPAWPATMPQRAEATGCREAEWRRWVADRTVEADAAEANTDAASPRLTVRIEVRRQRISRPRVDVKSNIRVPDPDGGEK